MLLESDAIAACNHRRNKFSWRKRNCFRYFFGRSTASVRNGLNLLNVNADIQTIVIGLVIIMAVFIDVIRSGAFKKAKKIKTTD